MFVSKLVTALAVTASFATAQAQSSRRPQNSADVLIWRLPRFDAGNPSAQSHYHLVFSANSTKTYDAGTDSPLFDGDVILIQPQTEAMRRKPLSAGIRSRRTDHQQVMRKVSLEKEVNPEEEKGAVVKEDQLQTEKVGEKMKKNVEERESANKEGELRQPAHEREKARADARVKKVKVDPKAEKVEKVKTDAREKNPRADKKKKARADGNPNLKADANQKARADAKVKKVKADPKAEKVEKVQTDAREKNLRAGERAPGIGTIERAFRMEGKSDVPQQPGDTKNTAQKLPEAAKPGTQPAKPPAENASSNTNTTASGGK
ncbi:hypothetical protein FQN57_004399 [Myotisia sp. PD_48]|nr:hypothetical protein FQN57_004399 [Myotisia sp. PD_48]